MVLVTPIVRCPTTDGLFSTLAGFHVSFSPSLDTFFRRWNFSNVDWSVVDNKTKANLSMGEVQELFAFWSNWKNSLFCLFVYLALFSCGVWSGLVSALHSNIVSNTLQYSLQYLADAYTYTCMQLNYKTCRDWKRKTNKRCWWWHCVRDLENSNETDNVNWEYKYFIKASVLLQVLRLFVSLSQSPCCHSQAINAHNKWLMAA